MALSPAEQGESGTHAAPLRTGEVRVRQLGSRKSYRVWERKGVGEGGSAGLFMKPERREEPGGARQGGCRSILRRRCRLGSLVQVTTDTASDLLTPVKK